MNEKRSRNSESSIVKAVKEDLIRQDFKVWEEMAILQRRVDLVAWNADLEQIIAVEAKIENWQVAVRQAKSCLLFAEKVFIAIPEMYVHRVDRAQLSAYGIGLIQVNSHVETLVEPVVSNYTSPYYRGQVFQRLTS
jgi:hypothetical protein